LSEFRPPSSVLLSSPLLGFISFLRLSLLQILHGEVCGTTLELPQSPHSFLWIVWLLDSLFYPRRPSSFGVFVFEELCSWGTNILFTPRTFFFLRDGISPSFFQVDISQLLALPAFFPPPPPLPGSRSSLSRLSHFRQFT